MLSSFFHGFKVPVKFYWDAAFDNVLQSRTTYAQLSLNYWLNYVFGHWYWWFLLFWTIFPLIIWWKYVDRNRFLEVSTFGLVVGLISGLMDTVGAFTGLWAYPYNFLPILPSFFPIDYVIVPIVFMLIYQKYTGWKNFIIANFIVASFLSLVLDPIMVLINLYQPLLWQYYYSIPTFVFIMIFAKWLITIIVRRDSHYS